MVETKLRLCCVSDVVEVIEVAEIEHRLCFNALQFILIKWKSFALVRSKLPLKNSTTKAAAPIARHSCQNFNSVYSASTTPIVMLKQSASKGRLMLCPRPVNSIIMPPLAFIVNLPLSNLHQSAANQQSLSAFDIIAPLRRQSRQNKRPNYLTPDNF